VAGVIAVRAAVGTGASEAVVVVVAGVEIERVAKAAVAEVAPADPNADQRTRTTRSKTGFLLRNSDAWCVMAR